MAGGTASEGRTLRYAFRALPGEPDGGKRRLAAHGLEITPRHPGWLGEPLETLFCTDAAKHSPGVPGGPVPGTSGLQQGRSEGMEGLRTCACTSPAQGLRGTRSQPAGSPSSADPEPDLAAGACGHPPGRQLGAVRVAMNFHGPRQTLRCLWLPRAARCALQRRLGLPHGSLGILLAIVLLGWTASLAHAETPKSTPAEAGEEIQTAPEKTRKPPALDTPYADERAGRDAAKEAEARVGVLDDKALRDYVNAIGQRIAVHAPGFDFDYHFRIADQAAPNAFALPGGWVFISRGLLALTVSEAELASVIGHEVAHVAARHAAARQGVKAVGFLAVLQTPWLAAYSRDLESTADRMGQELAAAAGYDPAALVLALDSLGSLDRLRLGAEREPWFLDTHPGPRSRAAEAGQRAQVLKWKAQPSIAGSRDAYLRRLDGLPLGQRASQGVFVGSRFLHPDLDLTVRFPEGWITRNTPAAVGAVAPRGDAQVFLEHAGSGADLERAVRTWIREGKAHGLQPRARRTVRVGGHQALQVVATSPEGHVLATFLSQGDAVYRIVGVSTSPSRNTATFENVARSFRPLTPAMRALIFERRLRLVEARAGESLAALSERTDNTWPVTELAVMNALQPDAELAEGQLIKIAVQEPYGVQKGGSKSPRSRDLPQLSR